METSQNNIPDPIVSKNAKLIEPKPPRSFTQSMIERFVAKVTSGRFIFTLVVAGVYAYLSINGTLPIDKTNEIILVVLYAYFNRPRSTDAK